MGTYIYFSTARSLMFVSLPFLVMTIEEFVFEMRCGMNEFDHRSFISLLFQALLAAA